MANPDYAELKKGGFMRQVQKDRFSLRLRVVGGQVKAEHVEKVNEVAKRYGQGYIHLTSRQSIEIPHISIEDIEKVKAELAEVGLQPGACGPRVRTITACQGSAVCSQGLIDTTELAKSFDKRYYGKDLPHKFKLGITGCANNCLKAEENDLGVKGGMKPEWNENNCNFCGLCEAVCRSKAIEVKKQEKSLRFEEKACTFCGKCVKACPTDTWQGRAGFIIYFGGLFGNRIAIGKQLVPIVFSEERLYEVIETVLMFFSKHGKKSERFGNTLDRVGWDLLTVELEKLS